jgi:hypothetical protein
MRSAIAEKILRLYRAIDAQSLYNRLRIAVQSPQNRCEINRSAIATHSLCNLCHITAGSLSKCRAIAVKLQRLYRAFIAQSTQNRLRITVKLICNRTVIAAESLRNLCRITAESRLKCRAIAVKLMRIHRAIDAESL